MKAILFLLLLVAISWTLLDVVDSKGVPAKRVKRQYYGGYGGYGYGGYGGYGGCNCPTYAPCPHGSGGGYGGYGYGGGYGGYGGYGYKK